MSGTLPVLGYDVPLEGPNGWHEVNRYLLWTGHFPLDAPPVAMQEFVEGKIVTLPVKRRSFSLIPAGTPHRLTHLFGFWRVSDADMLVLRAELPEATYLCLYVSSGPEHGHDRVQWYCANCSSVLAPLDVDVKRFGARAFWEERSLEHVRAFNADAALRTCPHGCLHRTAYGFDAERDTPEERAARAEW